MVLQQGTCQLFEMYAWNPTGPTTGWEALVQWDLNGDSEQIPDNLEIGSTTAAGTPLLPGVIWPDEVAAGAIEKGRRCEMFFKRDGAHGLMLRCA